MVFTKILLQRAIRAITVCVLAVVASGVLARLQAQASTTLVIESWRAGDETVWDEIIASFNKVHPEITVKFEPTKADQYNGALTAKLQSGTAGDILTCRPFTFSLNMFKAGNLLDPSELVGHGKLQYLCEECVEHPRRQNDFLCANGLRSTWLHLQQRLL